MRFCDNHPAVIAWASESLRVPYRNPFTGKETFYVPDFLITYQDKSGNKISEVIEVKPRGQAILELAKTQQEKAAVVLNMAKWEAASAWCKQQGIKFRVINEGEIFHQGGKRR
jgi:hypothetical protein